MAPKNLSVLQKINNAIIATDPYPYLVIKDALPSEIYDQLERTYPSIELMVPKAEMKSNTRYQASARQTELIQGLDPIWQEFIQYHTSEAYFAEVQSAFGDLINKTYPNIDKLLEKPFKDWTVGIRDSVNPILFLIVSLATILPY